MQYRYLASFNSRLHEEVDIKIVFLQFIHDLSIHDLTRRSTICTLTHRRSCGLSIHDLTRRSTLSGREKLLQTLSFNSRPHEEVDNTGLSGGPSGRNFQFTTSRGGRLAGEAVEPKKSTFNSRPHEEVDEYLPVFQQTESLSIHDLTRRSTRHRVLAWITAIAFNSRPHEEVDKDASYPGLSRQSFNSRPHEEVDTSSIHSSSTHSPFQFTTSRGGRRKRQSQAPCPSGLSIHDLTRRSTIGDTVFCIRDYLSIHDLTRRSTKCDKRFCVYNTFQFTTSRGGRLRKNTVFFIPFHLSIHDLTRRSTLRQ